MAFKLKRFLAIRRLFLWFSLFVSFTLGTAVRVLRRRDSLADRAARLRRAFEKRGGSFVKLGIHLSMRLDFLPWDYCVELSKMTDRMEPIPIADAVREVERAISKPLGAVFSRFDPEPIGSTSTACLYQAFFHDQTRVIVKIRRPGVGEQFMADLQAFDWLMMLAEFLTIFKPGFTISMRDDFRTYLLEELDFVNEARRQEMFRRAAAESGKTFFSAPKVYLEFSSEAVVVEEFASGMWLWELLAAVEHNDAQVLEYARSIHISPSKVARRLLWVHYWSLEENLFFRADTHPDNIILGRDSRLYFVNFAATGTLTRSKRQAMQQVMLYLREGDPQSMARASLVLMEPLPLIDLIELTEELEEYNWKLLYNLAASPESLKWQERTTAIQWLGILHLARKHHIVIDIQVLQLIRSTLLSEASAVRLCHDIDLLAVYTKFEDHRADLAGRRVIEQINRRLEGKENEQMILRMDRIALMLQSLFFRARHTLTIPNVNFSVLVNKWSFAFQMLIRFVLLVFAVSGAGILIYLGEFLLGAQTQLGPAIILRSLLLSPVYQLAILVLIIIHGRTVLFRLEDKELKAR